MQETTGDAADRRFPLRAAPDRRVWIVVALLLLVHAVIAWLARDPGITTRQDDATYVILAQSLRSGGYDDAYRPDTPVHNMYPPGYPAMIALWGWPFGDAFDWLVTLNIALSAGTLLLVFLTLRRFVPAWLAVLVLVPLAVNRGLVAYAGSVATETPYAFFTILSLYLLSAPEITTRRWGWACAAAVVAAMTRSIGVTLLAALWLHLALDRKWKPLALLTAASVLAVGGWLLWTIVSPEQFVGRSYVADAMASVRGTTLDGVEPNLPKRTFRRIGIYFGRNVPWAMDVPTVAGTPIDNVLATGAIVIGFAAGLLFFWRRWRPAALYLVAYLCLLFVWTFQTDRFVVPLVPLLTPAVILGLGWIAGLRSRRAGYVVAIAAAMILTAGGASRTAGSVRSGMRCDRGTGMAADRCLRRDQASYFAALRWVRENTPDDAIILTAKPEPLYLYTGRRSPSIRRALFAVAREDFLTHLREAGADYILLGSLQAMEMNQLPHAMKLSCEALAVAAYFPERTWLFRLREPGEPATREACRAIDRSVELNRNRRFGVDP